MTRIIHTLLLTLLSAVALSACTTAHVASSSGSGPTISEAQTEPYQGPKERIAVQPFEYKAAQGAGSVGDGLSDMLADSLFNTNRFILLERERMQDVIDEQNLSDTGRFRTETVAPKGELEGAELLIRGSVIQFEPNCRGGSLLLVSGKQACVSINLRIVDVRTGRIVNSTTVDGTSGSAGVGLIFATSPLPTGLGAWAQTPMEEAIRNCMEEAVRHIVETKL